MTAERLSLQPPRSAVEHHRRVKEVADALPMRFGPWVGEDEVVTDDAKRMLRPNVAINRRYRNLSTGLEVGYLFVQCGDARAIMDHYPPICYVGLGFNKDAARPTDWQAGDLAVAGTEYEFCRREPGEPPALQSAMVVDSFIVTPGEGDRLGAIERDMESTKAAASDPRRRFFGAAQFQLVFKRGISRAEREEAFSAFVGMSRPLIQAVRSGYK
jgi:hypothetical protein